MTGRENWSALPEKTLLGKPNRARAGERAKKAESKARDEELEGISKPESIVVDSLEDIGGGVVPGEVVAPRPMAKRTECCSPW